MTLRKAHHGCAVVPDGGFPIVIGAWDDETGLVVTLHDEIMLPRGSFVPDTAVSASIWPQLLTPDQGWHDHVVPDPVRYLRDGRQAYGLAVAWNEESHEIRVVDATQRISFDPATGPPAVRTFVLGPDDYRPVDARRWPPVPRPNAEAVEADATTLDDDD